MALAQAAALERMKVAAQVMVAMSGSAYAGIDDTEAGQDDDGLRAGVGLFRSSLAAVAPDIGERLDRALEALAETAEQGAPPAGPAQDVVDLARQAERALLTPDRPDAPQVEAALMASLLLDEGGVAESYAEAVQGDPAAYLAGWFALARVNALWRGLAGHATPQQSAEAEAMLAMLGDLFPGESPPPQMAAYPEQAEAPAQQLVGLLETIVDADLYPDRDLVGAVARVRDIAAEGCADLAAGDAGAGREMLMIATALYDRTVAETLAVLAPDLRVAIAQGLQAVRAGGSTAAVRVCPDLLDALAAGREAFES
ncbi:MAG: hypothetical protein KDA73_12435 [Rhodobacteraceae bacterium]|nr:hypothetical protein [Paracoccaceae bacterium]